MVSNKKTKQNNQTHRKRVCICSCQRQGVGKGGIGGRWSKGTDFQLCDKKKSTWNVMYSMNDYSYHCVYDI